MYGELVKELRDSAEWADRLALLMGRAEGDTHAPIMRKAADAIEELQLYADLYKDLTEKGAREVIDKYPKWIPVTERLPETYGTRLVTTARGSVMVCCYYPQAKNWNTRATVTHWMPLPTPPKEET